MDITPGQHRLTLRVDNRMIINVGPNASSMTDHTQGSWNGIVGRIKLAAHSPVWLDAIQVYPDLKRKVARVEAAVKNAIGISGSAALVIHIFWQ